MGENDEETPNPAEALPEPQFVETNQKLFLGYILGNTRHATYSPEDYYSRGLRRDKTDIRLSCGYRKYLYNKGQIAESEKYFQTAIKSSTEKS